MRSKPPKRRARSPAADSERVSARDTTSPAARPAPSNSRWVSSAEASVSSSARASRPARSPPASAVSNSAPPSATPAPARRPASTAARHTTNATKPSGSARTPWPSSQLIAPVASSAAQQQTRTAGAA